jgi:long-chain acyl-CoA synthetase
MATEIASGDLAELVRHQASTRPDTVAMVVRGRETTYRKLDDCANQVANGLLAINTAPQMRVAVLARNSAVFYEVLFGAAKARDVLLAVNWRLAPSEIAYILNDAEAEVLFVGEEFFPVVAQIRPELRTVKHVIA